MLKCPVIDHEVDEMAVVVEVVAIVEEVEVVADITEAPHAIMIGIMTGNIVLINYELISFELIC